MFQEIIRAFMLIFIAEMGDKTQILAMAFATKFSVKKVLLGIFLGALLNHGLAVALGSFISNFVPVSTMQIIAGFAFVGFSLCTLRHQEDGVEGKEQKFKFGPVLTVALAFFLGELGDKTQLAAITLASDAVYPLAILTGTVFGMIVTGGMGIIVGKKLGDKIPEIAIKIGAAFVFMLFGITKLFQTLPNKYLSIPNITIFFGILSLIVYLLLRNLLIKRKKGIASAYLVSSKKLYDYYYHMAGDIDNICLGVEKCKTCQGEQCIIGFAKSVVHKRLDEDETSFSAVFNPSKDVKKKTFNKDNVIDSLIDTLIIVKNDPENDEYVTVHSIRKLLELLLLNQSIATMNDWKSYKKEFADIDSQIAEQVFSIIK